MTTTLVSDPKDVLARDTAVDDLHRNLSASHGIWIGLHLTDPVCLLGQVVERAHCTLVHLGRVGDRAYVKAAASVVDELAADWRDVSRLRVGGVARFRAGVEGDPLVVLVQDTRLRLMRRRAIESMARAGHPVRGADSYDYTPHVTVRRVTAPVVVDRVAEMVVGVSAIGVTCGDASYRVSGD